MQSQETSSDEIVHDRHLEHTRYGSVLKDVIRKSTKETRLMNSNSECSYEMGISLQLEVICVGVQVILNFFLKIKNYCECICFAVSFSK